MMENDRAVKQGTFNGRNQWDYVTLETEVNPYCLKWITNHYGKFIQP